MSNTYSVGDRVRLTVDPQQTDTRSGISLAVGDVGTVADVITEESGAPEWLLGAMFGDARPMFVEVDGKPFPSIDGDAGTDGWPLLTSEVEPYASEDVA